MNLFKRFAILALISAGMPALVQAYQTVHVGGGAAKGFVNPTLDSPLVATLKAGAVLNVGDQPSYGFYKCAAAGGISGWVQANSVVGLRA